MSVMCLKCEKIYRHQQSLNKHLRRDHNEERNVRSYDFSVYKAKCMTCMDCSFRSISDLRYHLDLKHDFANEISEHTFYKWKEFHEWLDTISVNENVNFCKQSGFRGNKTYYYCNRSAYTYKTKPSKRLSKRQGSCKLDFLCTCQIVVTQVDEKLEVTWYKSHYNHDKSIEHLRIPKTERIKIANKLASGVSVSRIMEQAMDHVTEDKLERINFLTRKDVRNIKNSFSIQNVDDGRSNPRNDVSVDMWVEEQMSPGAANSVLLYEKKNNECDTVKNADFCLIVMNETQQYMLKKFGKTICIDSTHGLKKYDFDLTMLMVVDEHAESFPCAFMFTNRKDADVFKLFFEKIKEQVGTILTKTFMTDGNPVFFSAWYEVMGPPEHQIYSAWHIDQEWKKNLTKIKSQEKKELVYETLKYLEQFEDENTFEEELIKIINFFNSDVETEAFGNYFETNYCHNFKFWASCYRKECNIYTNMHLEAAHKTIKYCHLKCTKVQRFDKGLNAVLKFIRDKTVERITKNKKGNHLRKRKLAVYEPIRTQDDNEIEMHVETFHNDASDVNSIDTFEEDITSLNTFEEDITTNNNFEEDITSNNTFEEDITSNNTYEEDITSFNTFEEDITSNDTFEEDIAKDFNEIIEVSKYITDINLLSQCRDHIKKARLLLTESLSNEIECVKGETKITQESSNNEIEKGVSFFSTKKMIIVKIPSNVEVIRNEHDYF